MSDIYDRIVAVTKDAAGGNPRCIHALVEVLGGDAQDVYRRLLRDSSSAEDALERIVRAYRVNEDFIGLLLGFSRHSGDQHLEMRVLKVAEDAGLSVGEPWQLVGKIPVDEAWGPLVSTIGLVFVFLTSIFVLAASNPTPHIAVSEFLVLALPAGVFFMVVLLTDPTRLARLFVSFRYAVISSASGDIEGFSNAFASGHGAIYGTSTRQLLRRSVRFSLISYLIPLLVFAYVVLGREGLGYQVE